MELNKSLVIITGASSGIGAALAKVFSTAGYPLGLFARNKTAMDDLHLPSTLSLSVDVTNFASLKNAIRLAEEKFGPVDCLINNAGFAKGGDYNELTHDEHMQTVNVNLVGVMNGIEIVIPEMRKRKTGTIINVSSVADRAPRPNNATYAATKAAIKSLSDSLRVANAKFGIRICNLAPAKIDTPMLIATHLKDNQIIPVENLAKTVLWIYEQPQSICIRDIVVAPTAYES